jgi:hypothetical protein
MRAEIIAAGETDWRRVAEACATGGERPVFFQKHMVHHMIPEFGTGWLDRVTNAFLIRAPERVLASYAQKRERPVESDIGFLRQGELFDRVADRLGRAPPVIEAEEVRAAPARVLGGLCAALGIGFDPAMLAWPAGPRAGDGVWGPHWYDGLWRSTGFAPPDPPPPKLPAELARLAEIARPVFERLQAHRISA